MLKTCALQQKFRLGGLSLSSSYIPLDPIVDREIIHGRSSVQRYSKSGQFFDFFELKKIIVTLVLKRDGRSCEVSVLDTAGELQFPAMRRLSISSAHGFLLIYEVTQPNSLELLKHTITEIQQVEYKEQNFSKHVSKFFNSLKSVSST